MKTAALSLFFAILSAACGQTDESTSSVMEGQNEETPRTVSVDVTGEENAYTFSVGILSPDTGCDQYADWWEIVSLEGDLIYRRILAHSHVNEQPFVRSGGPVAISEGQTVRIRVHMNTSGYSNFGSRGSVAGGFTGENIEDGFASNLETMAPLPDGCAF